MHSLLTRLASRRREADAVFLKAVQDAPVILTNADGVRFILQPWERRHLAALLNGKLLDSELSLLRKLACLGDVAFDVGANVGSCAALLSKRVGPLGRVYAFEPVPETHWQLRETLALNRCQNVVTIESAICDRVGETEMHLFDVAHSAWNTLGNPVMTEGDGAKLRPSRAIRVTTDTLDHFCAVQGLEQVDVLKVDVEGFEKAVFEGASSLLAAQRVAVLIFEISQDPLRGAGTTAREVFATLERFGYLAYQYDRSRASFSGPIGDTQTYYDNYVATSDIKNLQRADKNALA